MPGRPVQALTSIQLAACERVRAEIERLLPDCKADAQAALFCIALAARLEAVGDNRYEQLWRDFGDHDLFQLLRRRFLEGIRELNIVEGNSLGHAIIEAQDYCCFLAFHGKELMASPRYLPTEFDDLRRVAEIWFDDANHTYLDSEAFETIEVFRNLFPISEDLMLSVIALPMIPGLLSLLPNRFTKKTVEKRWRAANVSHLRPTHMLDDDLPSRFLCGSLRHDEELCSVFGEDDVLVSQQLLSDAPWRLRITIENANDSGSMPVVSVRVGKHVGYRERLEDSRVWLVQVEPCRGSPEDYSLLTESLVIIFRPHVILRLH